LPDWAFIGGWGAQDGELLGKLPDIIILSHLTDTMTG